MSRYNLVQAARQLLKEMTGGKPPSTFTMQELERALALKFDGMFGALNAPIAPYTWMVRAALTPDQDEALLENLTWPGPCEILGYFTTLCTLVEDADGPQKLPPLEAIDVMFRVDQRETYTSRIDNAQTNTSGSKDVVNAPMMQVMAPRLLGIELVGPQPAVNTTIRWAVPPKVRKYQGWGPTQVSVGFLVRDLSRGGR